MNSKQVNPSDKQITVIDHVRTRILHQVLLLSAFFGVVSFSLDAMLAFRVGWKIENYGLALVLIIITLLALFRHRVPYTLKALTVLTAIYTVGLLNLTGWGLVGSGAIWFMMFILLTVIFFRLRYSLFAYGLVTATIGIITALFYFDVIMLNVDYELYHTSIVSWLFRIVIILVISAILIMSIGRLIMALHNQVHILQETTTSLEHRTTELTREIQKREQAEASLADAISQLKALDALKDQFIESASHELRTPIANLQLYTQLLNLKPDKASQYIETLTAETDRLRHIIEQLIYASGDSFDVQLTTMVEIDIYQMTRALFEAQQERLTEKQISLNLPNQETNFLTLAATEHMERLLHNVIDNAVKYTPDDGQITVTMQKYQSPQDEERIQLNISNTSSCLAEQDERNLFERFYRGEASLTYGVAGAGLGLSISKQLIEQYGGSIKVDCDETQNMISFTLDFVAVRPFKEILAETQTTVLPST
ncbi:MAG: HAMP domain-containing sensor histidine kinase [Chloroflexota bacterium]